MSTSFRSFLLHSPLAMIHAVNAVDSARLKLVDEAFIGSLYRKTKEEFARSPLVAVEDILWAALIKALQHWATARRSLAQLAGKLPGAAADSECATVMPISKTDRLLLAGARVRGSPVSDADPARLVKQLNDELRIQEAWRLPDDARRYWLADAAQPDIVRGSTNPAESLRNWLGLDHLPKDNLPEKQRLRTQHLVKFVFPYDKTDSLRFRPSTANGPGARFRARTDVESKARKHQCEYGRTVNIANPMAYADAAEEIFVEFPSHFLIDGARFEVVPGTLPELRPPHFHDHEGFLTFLLRGRRKASTVDAWRTLSAKHP